ncbi:hypothetical protein SKAU_G00245390 [Synaphobranchus kaupii]|uniref:Uncharacterized protein n=1 Tax=Synaphobranchus kaupii TaxID=118154 RepID=A0A9Q1F1S5_SYNKA|nr:hypothetical protein SKAU_G00245390 [Synaphobranchus kaupii]
MPSPFPTLCNQCPSLRAKINELEGRISNLYSIREDEILIDSLAAASRIVEATDLESSAPCFPPAADRDRGTELGAKPKSPACSTPIVSAPWSTVPTGRRRGRRTGRPLPREKLSLENRYQVLDELSRPEQATPSQPRSRGSAVPVSAVHRGTMHPPVTAHPLGASQPLNGAWTRPSRSIVREKPPRVPPTGPPTTLVVGSSMVRHLNFFSAETLCYPGGLVMDINSSITSALREHPMASNAIVHIGSNDIKLQQSEKLPLSHGSELVLSVEMNGGLSDLKQHSAGQRDQSSRFTQFMTPQRRLL